jgi:hypothetical protein
MGAPGEVQSRCGPMGLNPSGRSRAIGWRLLECARAGVTIGRPSFAMPAAAELAAGADGPQPRSVPRSGAQGKAANFKELLRMESDYGTNNIRSVNSVHWKRWLDPAQRRPFTASPNTTRSKARRRRAASLQTIAVLSSALQACGPTAPARGTPKKPTSTCTPSEICLLKNRNEHPITPLIEEAE